MAADEVELRSLRWLDHGDRPALHLEPGGGTDRVLGFDELRRAVRRRAVELREGTVGADGGDGAAAAVTLVERAHPAEQLIEILAAVSAGRSVLPLNGAWFPRERDAALDRLADSVGPAGRHPAGRADPEPLLWLATAGSEAEPTPYAFTAEQLARWWTVPGAIDGVVVRPGDRVLLTGEVAHAPVLRAVLGALAAGATVQLTGRAHLAALLAAASVELLCTTPLLLRRALRQLQRRDRTIAGVGQTLLHQGAVRAHEHERWPAMLNGMVRERVSLTEAGGWLPDGFRSGAAPGPAGAHPPHGAAAGLTVQLDGSGRVRVAGGCTAVRSATGPATGDGWATGDVALTADGTVLHPAVHAAPAGAPSTLSPPARLRRARDWFVAGGVSVDPVAVEAAVAAHPLVADVVVAPRPHPEAGNVVVAVLVPSDPEWPPFVADLDEVTGHLPPAARPAALAIVEDLPTSAAGTVSRRLVVYEEAGR